VNGADDPQRTPLRAAHRMAYAMGLALCVGTPALIAGLLISGIIPPGAQVPEGTVLQIGYLFTGIVFLSATWVLWRSGRVLRDFRQLPCAQQPQVILRESLIYSAVFESSAILGLIYWMLVGTHAARHAWGFIVLTPVLFFSLVPRGERWMKALEG
jgi:hypothetical protein